MPGLPVACLSSVFLFVPTQPLRAQAGAVVSGQVVHSVTLQPIAAVVRIGGLNREIRTDADGRYVFDNVPPGSHRLVIAASGFVPRRLTIDVEGPSFPPLDISLDPELHYTEVLSVSPDARSQFESYQPTSVLSGQDLAIQLEATLSATLKNLPGLAERSFGPAPGRPVIRGLEGVRVLILEDGQRMGDLSSQAGDHAVAVNPAAASRIEVVRGPATLLYGANAIGGLINVISDMIPTRPAQGSTGSVTVNAGSAAKEAGSAADILWGNGQWAVHAAGSGRRSGNVMTPEGEVENTQSHGGFGSFGASWTREHRFAGVSYGYNNLRYGTPVIDGRQIERTPRRHLVGFRAGASELEGLFESVRGSFSHRRYHHEELEGNDVAIRWENTTSEATVHAKHRTLGRLGGAIGGWFLDRQFVAPAGEPISPPVHERGYAVFVFEELTWPHATVQAGGRVDRAQYHPEGGLRPRGFTEFSGSLGLLIHPPAAADHLTLAFNLARASRHPALEELYFFGVDPGNFSFEIGNDALESEHGLGFDASVRWRYPRMAGELTYFRNRIDDYIFRNPISEETFEQQFGPREEDEEEGDFPLIQFTAADSLLQGVEGHIDVELSRRFTAEFGLNSVRGELRASHEPLPRIPPWRLRTGLRYQANAFQASGEIMRIANQRRIFGQETPTDGATLLALSAAYSFAGGDATHTVGVRMDNATNTEYRNHLSLIKDLVPEMGRNIKATYRVRF